VLLLCNPLVLPAYLLFMLTAPCCSIGFQSHTRRITNCFRTVMAVSHLCKQLPKAEMQLLVRLFAETKPLIVLVLVCSVLYALPWYTFQTLLCIHLIGWDMVNQGSYCRRDQWEGLAKHRLHTVDQWYIVIRIFRDKRKWDRFTSLKQILQSSEFLVWWRCYFICHRGWG
jgi:hypothetical protein